MIQPYTKFLSRYPDLWTIWKMIFCFVMISMLCYVETFSKFSMVENTPIWFIERTKKLCTYIVDGWYHFWSTYVHCTKGQIILKCFFLVSSISSKKQTKEFDFTNMIPQVDLFSFVFGCSFEINWPLAKLRFSMYTQKSFPCIF